MMSRRFCTCSWASQDHPEAGLRIRKVVPPPRLEADTLDEVSDWASQDQKFWMKSQVRRVKIRNFG